MKKNLEKNLRKTAVGAFSAAMLLTAAPNLSFAAAADLNWTDSSGTVNGAYAQNDIKNSGLTDAKNIEDKTASATTSDFEKSIYTDISKNKYITKGSISANGNLPSDRRCISMNTSMEFTCNGITLTLAETEGDCVRVSESETEYYIFIKENGAMNAEWKKKQFSDSSDTATYRPIQNNDKFLIADEKTILDTNEVLLKTGENSYEKWAFNDAEVINLGIKESAATSGELLINGLEEFDDVKLMQLSGGSLQNIGNSVSADDKGKATVTKGDANIICIIRGGKIIYFKNLPDSIDKYYPTTDLDISPTVGEIDCNNPSSISVTVTRKYDTDNVSDDNADISYEVGTVDENKVFTPNPTLTSYLNIQPTPGSNDYKIELTDDGKKVSKDTELTVRFTANNCPKDLTITIKAIPHFNWEGDNVKIDSSNMAGSGVQGSQIIEGKDSSSLDIIGLDTANNKYITVGTPADVTTAGQIPTALANGQFFIESSDGTACTCNGISIDKNNLTANSYVKKTGDDTNCYLVEDDVTPGIKKLTEKSISALLESDKFLTGKEENILSDDQVLLKVKEADGNIKYERWAYDKNLEQIIEKCTFMKYKDDTTKLMINDLADNDEVRLMYLASGGDTLEFIKKGIAAEGFLGINFVKDGQEANKILIIRDGKIVYYANINFESEIYSPVTQLKATLEGESNELNCRDPQALTVNLTAADMHGVEATAWTESGAVLEWAKCTELDGTEVPYVDFAYDFDGTKVKGCKVTLSAKGKKLATDKTLNLKFAIKDDDNQEITQSIEIEIKGAQMNVEDADGQPVSTINLDYKKKGNEFFKLYPKYDGESNTADVEYKFGQKSSSGTFFAYGKDTPVVKSLVCEPEYKTPGDESSGVDYYKIGLANTADAALIGTKGKTIYVKFVNKNNPYLSSQPVPVSIVGVEESDIPTLDEITIKKTEGTILKCGLPNEIKLTLGNILPGSDVIHYKIGHNYAGHFEESDLYNDFVDVKIDQNNRTCTVSLKDDSAIIGDRDIMLGDGGYFEILFSTNTTTKRGYAHIIISAKDALSEDKPVNVVQIVNGDMNLSKLKDGDKIKLLDGTEKTVLSADQSTGKIISNLDFVEAKKGEIPAVKAGKIAIACDSSGNCVCDGVDVNFDPEDGDCVYALDGTGNIDTNNYYQYEGGNFVLKTDAKNIKATTNFYCAESDLINSSTEKLIKTDDKTYEVLKMSTQRNSLTASKDMENKRFRLSTAPSDSVRLFHVDSKNKFTEVEATKDTTDAKGIWYNIDEQMPLLPTVVLVFNSNDECIYMNDLGGLENYYKLKGLNCAPDGINDKEDDKTGIDLDTTTKPNEWFANIIINSEGKSTQSVTIRPRFDDGDGMTATDYPDAPKDLELDVYPAAPALQGNKYVYDEKTKINNHGVELNKNVDKDGKFDGSYALSLSDDGGKALGTGTTNRYICFKAKNPDDQNEVMQWGYLKLVLEKSATSSETTGVEDVIPSAAEGKLEDVTTNDTIITGYDVDPSGNSTPKVLQVLGVGTGTISNDKKFISDIVSKGFEKSELLNIADKTVCIVYDLAGQKFYCDGIELDIINSSGLIGATPITFNDGDCVWAYDPTEADNISTTEYYRWNNSTQQWDKKQFSDIAGGTTENFRTAESTTLGTNVKLVKAGNNTYEILQIPDPSTIDEADKVVAKKISTDSNKIKLKLKANDKVKLFYFDENNNMKEVAVIPYDADDEYDVDISVVDGDSKSATHFSVYRGDDCICLDSIANIPNTYYPVENVKLDTTKSGITEDSAGNLTAKITVKDGKGQDKITIKPKFTDNDGNAATDTPALSVIVLDSSGNEDTKYSNLFSLDPTGTGTYTLSYVKNAIIPDGNKASVQFVVTNNPTVKLAKPMTVTFTIDTSDNDDDDDQSGNTGDNKGDNSASYKAEKLVLAPEASDGITFDNEMYRFVMPVKGTAGQKAITIRPKFTDNNGNDATGAAVNTLDFVVAVDNNGELEINKALKDVFTLKANDDGTYTLAYSGKYSLDEDTVVYVVFNTKNPETSEPMDCSYLLEVTLKAESDSSTIEDGSSETDGTADADADEAGSDADEAESDADEAEADEDLTATENYKTGDAMSRVFGALGTMLAALGTIIVSKKKKDENED